MKRLIERALKQFAGREAERSKIALVIFAIFSTTLVGFRGLAANTKVDKTGETGLSVGKPGTSKAPSKDPKRILEFPPFPIGKIFLVPDWNVLNKRNDGTLLAVAKGSVEVPSSVCLLLKLDYYIQTHPHDLKVPESNIVEIDGDALALEDDVCSAIAKIPSIQRVDLTSSDVSDAGIKILAKMDSMRCIMADKTMVDGSCLQALGTAKNLVFVDLGQNAIKPQYFKDFACLTRVEYAKLVGLPLTDDGLKYIGQMKALYSLSLKKNTKLTSAGMKNLIPLKKLRRLDIQETNIGAEGIETLLQNLNLATLSINAKIVSSEQRERLRAKYPRTSITFSATRDTEENHSLFAPLK